MQSISSSKKPGSGGGPRRLLLSLGLPFLLLASFGFAPFIDFDGMGWSSGFNHPLTGWDHLLTMLAVGIWAAQLRGQAVWMLPLAFVGVMSLGGIAGAAGLAIPIAEGIILLSGAVFTVLITRKVRFSTKINVLIVAFFAFFHGYAHGQEISTSASLISYTLGFMLATLLLHGAGILVAKLVVLAVSCLLAFMFSNTALARTAESIIDAQANANAAGPMQMTPSVWDTGQSAYGNYRFVMPGHESGSSTPDAGGGCRLTAALSARSAEFAKMLPGHAGSGKLTPNGDSGGLIVKQASPKAMMPWGAERMLPASCAGYGGLGFRHYFPDINHTPGKNLLSNGVGLTSPPAAIPDVLAFQASPKFHDSPDSFAEEPSLQRLVAKAATGDPASEILIHRWHDRTSRDRRNGLRFNVFRFLTPIETHGPANGSAMAGSGGFKDEYG